MQAIQNFELRMQRRYAYCHSSIPHSSLSLSQLRACAPVEKESQVFFLFRYALKILRWERKRMAASTAPITSEMVQAHQTPVSPSKPKFVKITGTI